MNSPPVRAQGSLEYLLLIGGAVLVSTVVLLLILASSSPDLVGDNLGEYQNQLTLETFVGGDPSPPGDVTPPTIVLFTAIGGGEWSPSRSARWTKTQ